MCPSFFQLPEDEFEKKNTIRNYEFVLGNFQEQFGEAELSSITPEDVLDFMTKLTEGKKQSTKKLRFALLSAFFNFVKNSLDSDFQNPCDSPALKKIVQGRKNDSDHDSRQGRGR
jgi:integrase/recombinase XerD